MSNQSSLGFGFMPRKHRDGREYVGGGIPCYIPASDSNNYFLGDPVILTKATNDTVNTTPILPKNQVGGYGFGDIGTLPIVGAITAGTSDYISGVIVHIGYDPASTARAPYRVASQEAIVWIEISPDVVYEARLANLTTAPGTTLVGNTATVYAGAGGNTTTGTSSYAVDGGTLQTATGTTYQLRIVELSRDLLNGDTNSANPNVYCMFNLSTETLPATAI